VSSFCPDFVVRSVGYCFRARASRLSYNKYIFTYYVGSAGCQTWTPFANTNIPASQQNTATTLQACQSACQNNLQCNGIDWVSNAAFGTQCRLSFPWSGSKNIGQAFGTTHYDLNRNCQGQIFTVLTEFCQKSRQISGIIIVQLCRAHAYTSVLCNMLKKINVTSVEHDDEACRRVA